VRDLARLSDRRLLLLSGDKGFAREDLLGGRAAPEIAVHGSFSLMVNYHAIGRWFEHRDGTYLHTSHLRSSLSVVACLLGTPPGGTVETRLAFDEAIERSGPDDFFDLKKSMEIRREDLSLEQILAWMRFSGWDSNVVLGYLPALMELAGTAPELLRREICRMVQEVWKACAPLVVQEDLAFQLGVLLCAIEHFEEALGLFHESVRLYGANPATLYNIALCLFELGNAEAAGPVVEQALEGAPDFEPALVLQQAITGAARAGRP
jgi:hypothetical protein